MAEPPGGFTPYVLEYSGRVQDELTALIVRARIHGRHSPLVTAARTVDYRLRVYPQSGQPLRDLVGAAGQLWVGVVPPLVVHYVIFEERRLVSVALPLKLMRGYDIG